MKYLAIALLFREHVSAGTKVSKDAPCRVSNGLPQPGHVITPLEPVDDLPDVLKVVGSYVLIVKVVCMFPDVYSEQRAVSRVKLCWSVLVLCLSVLEDS